MAFNIFFSFISLEGRLYNYILNEFLEWESLTLRKNTRLRTFTLQILKDQITNVTSCNV